MGDFNCLGINRCDNFVSGIDLSFSAMFFNSCQDAFLSQHVCSPTRYLPNQCSSVLDLVFTYYTDMIETVIHLPLIGHRDHECLFWSLLYARSPTLSDKPHSRTAEAVGLLGPMALPHFGLSDHVTLNEWRNNIGSVTIIFDLQDVDMLS